MYTKVINKILLPLGSLFFSGNYSNYLNQWRKYDKMTEEELESIQKKKLQEILIYCREKVPYYKNLQLPKNPALRDFPILTKQLLRENSNLLISEDFEKEKLEKNHSSGSSGEQSFTYMTYDHKFFLRALQTHWWMWGGYKPGEFMVQTGISPKRTLPKRLKDIFFRTRYVEAFALNQQKIREILKESQTKDPKHLAGYPSALNEIALTAIADNQVYPFKSLISYGDKLFDHFRPNFKAAFDNPNIINTYGCAEGMLMACQDNEPFYYIMSPHVYLEIVDENGQNVTDGERGHILVTCLTNRAMPLIRYKLGDLGVLMPKEKYPKKRKRNYPILQEVTGRETDVIKAPNGNVLVIHSFTGILEYYEAIKQYKVIQKAKDRLVIEYITDKEEFLAKEVQDEISGKLDKLTENSMQIEFISVSEIKPSPSGKPQIIEIKPFQK